MIFDETVAKSLSLSIRGRIRAAGGAVAPVSRGWRIPGPGDRPGRGLVGSWRLRAGMPWLRHLCPGFVCKVSWLRRSRRARVLSPLDPSFPGSVFGIAAWRGCLARWSGVSIFGILRSCRSLAAFLRARDPGTAAPPWWQCCVVSGGKCPVPFGCGANGRGLAPDTGFMRSEEISGGKCPVRARRFQDDRRPLDVPAGGLSRDAGPGASFQSAATDPWAVRFSRASKVPSVTGSSCSLARLSSSRARSACRSGPLRIRSRVCAFDVPQPHASVRVSAAEGVSSGRKMFLVVMVVGQTPSRGREPTRCLRTWLRDPIIGRPFAGGHRPRECLCPHFDAPGVRWLASVLVESRCESH